ncbi:MAG: hypothetical protein IJ308_04840 [Clostridia bacterium]|nr:hypothetical protein [Clostridia bacterium]
MKKKLALLMSLLLSASTVGFTACGEKNDVITSDYYTITVACQTEKGEKEVMEVLANRYEEKYPDRKVEIVTMANGYDSYMLTLSSSRDMSANVIWTSDTLHSAWDEFHVDLRPYYEQSAETDYSLYYETMLDTAGTNGSFKPTKNYTGEFRKDDLDTTEGRSEYGLYYAPRDYNKPALLCNTYIFAKLDTEYEALYKSLNSLEKMPTDYQSATARLNEIVEGKDWEDMSDLYAFAKTIAGRIAYLVNNHPDNKTARSWDKYRALNLFLDWEPTYTTVMYDMGVDLINDSGDLQLEQYNDQFTEIYNALSPSETAEDKELAPYLHTTQGDTEFSQGTLFMRVCSRPLVLGYGNYFRGVYGSTSLQAIRLPMEYIASGNSGYAISRVWDGENKGVKVNGVFKSYTELSWDFIKFIITQEGQEAAGATGLNIPVLKSLYDAESNGGVEPAWRTVESLGDMDNDAWVAGKELKQDLFNIYKPKSRPQFRQVVKFFFIGLQKYSNDAGYLADLINTYTKEYKNENPKGNLLG